MNLSQDLRYAIRLLRVNRGFTVVAVLTLALGIGANTALFSVLDAVLLKSLPVRYPDQLVLLSLRNARGEQLKEFSYPLFSELRARNRTLTGLVAVSPGRGQRLEVRVPPAGETEAAMVDMVSGNFFEVLGVHAHLGQTLTAADDQPPGVHPAVVLSDRYWTGRFGASPSIIGRTISIQDVAFTVVGVTPPGFFGNVIGALPDMWMPASMQPVLWNGRDFLTASNTDWLHVMGRLRPGVTRAQAQFDLEQVLKQIQRDWEGTSNRKGLPEGPTVVVTLGDKGFSDLREQFAQPLWILMAAVGLVLLIACVNVANLLMARAVSRQREIAIRVAVGATQWDLIRQFLTESLLLSFLGGSFGLLVAFWGIDLLLPLLADRGGSPPYVPRVDLQLLAFTTVVSLGAGVLFGTIPAVRSAKQKELSLPKGAAAGNPRLAFGRTLVIFQVAVSLLLVAGAGLFVRTLQNLRAFDAGFDRQHLLLVRTDPGATGFKSSQIAELNRRLQTHVGAVSGVRSVSQSMVALMSGRSRGCCITVPGYTPVAGERMAIRTNDVTPSYFSTVGMALVEGRSFTDSDRLVTPRLVIVNEAFVRRYISGGSPIGLSFAFERNSRMQIIGVVRNASYDSLREPSPPLVFFPVPSDDRPLQSIEVLAVGDPRTVATAVRRAIAAAEPRLPVREIITVGQLMDSSLARERLMARLSGFFGVLALGLACLGLYGLMAHWVARRTNEIGIRVAMGAERRQVIGLVLRQAGLLVAPGAVVGLAAALAGTRVLASLLFGVTPTDPLALGTATILLTSAAFAAAYVPARRAAGIDPMTALRQE